MAQIPRARLESGDALRDLGLAAPHDLGLDRRFEGRALDQRRSRALAAVTMP
jgi:hypothetical protein